MYVPMLRSFSCSAIDAIESEIVIDEMEVATSSCEGYAMLQD